MNFKHWCPSRGYLRLQKHIQGFVKDSRWKLDLSTTPTFEPPPPLGFILGRKLKNPSGGSFLFERVLFKGSKTVQGRGVGATVFSWGPTRVSRTAARDLPRRPSIASCRVTSLRKGKRGPGVVVGEFGGQNRKWRKYLMLNGNTAGKKCVTYVTCDKCLGGKQNQR